MGNFVSDLNVENINQTQIEDKTQKCNQSSGSLLSDVQITAINSHIGDITLTSSVSAKDFQCVLTEVSQQVAASAVGNSSDNTISSWPFQQTLNVVGITDITNIQSFQQSVVNQTCTESAFTELTKVDLTFIDSTTGNIKVASSAAVESFSCNLSSTTYQQATAAVTDAQKTKITSGCCEFGLGMLVPLLIGIVAVIVVSKVATRKPGGLAGGPQDPLAAKRAEIVSLSNQLASRPAPRSSMIEMKAL